MGVVLSGIPIWARVGAKVVCVDDSPTRRLGDRELRKGSIYTIEWIGIARAEWPHPVYGIDGVPGVRLIEVKRERAVPFALARFRPLVEDSDERGIEAQFYYRKGLHSKPSKREVADA